MDEPISNHVQAVNMLLARNVAGEATVVLGGDGGDELFGGYERYFYSHKIDQIQKIIPRALLALVAPRFASKSGVERYMQFFAQKEDMVSRFLSPSSNRPRVTEKILSDQYFKNADAHDFTRQFMRTDIFSWLPSESLVRSDKMSMAASIEGRVPFLDHRLVELADRIPISYKLGSKGTGMFSLGKGYQGKIILREAMREYLPHFVLEQPKWGWFSPAAKWLRGPLLPLAREVLSQD